MFLYIFKSFRYVDDRPFTRRQDITFLLVSILGFLYFDHIRGGSKVGSYYNVIHYESKIIAKIKIGSPFKHIKILHYPCPQYWHHKGASFPLFFMA